MANPTWEETEPTWEDTSSLDSNSPQPTKQRGMIGKAWDTLKVPEQKSREGLKMMANAIPDANTSSYPLNAVLNTPKLAVETLADVAPSFVSRGSLATGGILKGAQLAGKVAPIANAAKAAGKFIGKGAEEISGLTYKTPGVLAETYKDPSLFFANSLDKARQMYREAKGLAPEIRSEFKEAMTNQDLVSKAWEAVKVGTLSGDEALEARKAITKIKKNIPDETFKTLKDAFDQVAKTKFGDADIAFQRGIKAENMRRLLPINKGGTPSLAKGAAMSIMPKLAFVAPPVVQGAAAAGLGTLAKVGPATASSAAAILDAIFGNGGK